jgi:predicted ATPase
VVGRSRETAEIARWLDLAASGRRQVGFVTGEPGIGKTTLVDTALRDLRRTSGPEIRTARGQCVEQYGGGEPYLPVLDALATLGRGPDAPSLAASLARDAPPWLLRLLGSAEPPDHDGNPTAGTSEHTLQRLAACLDALAAEKPFVLVLEDVQWSDYSTLDLLSVVARRRDAARLLVLCTLRPADAIVRGHPVAGVKRELLRTGQCRELLLDGLPPAEIAAYLAARFSGAEIPTALLPLLVERSAGNPFFMVALVDQLIEQDLLARDGVRWTLRTDVEQVLKAVPEGLRAAIEPRVERLAHDELRVLEAGSVAGPEFAADAVASVATAGASSPTSSMSSSSATGSRGGTISSAPPASTRGRTAP